MSKKIYPKKIGVCKKCGEAIIAKKSSFNRPTRKFCSYSCRTSWRNSNTPKTQKQIESIIRIGHLKKGKKDSLETRLRKSKSNNGSKSHFWKGGITDKNRLLRNSLQAKFFREMVFKRDNWTCKKCNNKGYVEVHHIKSWSKFPELRFNLLNAITLCKKCHRETDNFGNKQYKQIICSSPTKKTK